MNNPKIEYLAWDSDFFQKKVGRIVAENTDCIENLLNETKNNNYQLIYIFGKKDFFIDDKILKQFNGLLADRKILYEKEIFELVQSSPIVSEYKNKELISELEQLAYISGEFSRFKLDKNFDKNCFYRMYKIWMENSLKKQIADNIFVVKENDVINAMVTLKIDNKRGNIGLIGVSSNTQGKGYGKALINACENELLNKDISKLEVPTQYNNTQACKFYEKCGFKIKEITNIYHFWL